MRKIHLFISAAMLLVSGFAYAQSTQALSELEDAFLEKPKTSESWQQSRYNDSKPLTDKDWQIRIKDFLDLPALPSLEKLDLNTLMGSEPGYIVAILDSGEKDLVYKARQIDWLKAKTIFNEKAKPVVYATGASGGTFSIHRTFYTLIDQSAQFTIYYIPQRATSKISISFAGLEGTFLTPEGFICRIKKYIPGRGGIDS